MLNNQSLIPLKFYKLTYKITENHVEWHCGPYWSAFKENYMYLGWVNTYSQVSQFGQFRKHTAR